MRLRFVLCHPSFLNPRWKLAPVTHLCQETPPSRSDRGWHTHCHTWGRRQTGSIWRASVRSYADRATATAGHRWHEGILYVQPPGSNNTEQRENTWGDSFVNSLSLQLRSVMLGMQIVFSLPCEWQDLTRPQVSKHITQRSWLIFIQGQGCATIGEHKITCKHLINIKPLTYLVFNYSKSCSKNRNWKNKSFVDLLITGYDFYNTILMLYCYC